MTSGRTGTSQVLGNYLSTGLRNYVSVDRWEVDDVTTAGEAVWSGVHGHTTLELTGFFSVVSRDPVRSYSEILTRMSIGLGDNAQATARSLSTAKRRAVRADRAEAASAL